MLAVHEVRIEELPLSIREKERVSFRYKEDMK
jgi:hypothetical protein